MAKFKIKDWAGNTCFNGKTFKTFDDAWGYIYENDPAPINEETGEIEDESYFDDYYVEAN